MNIAVVGMGKIGLPLAVQYARKGHIVTGTDINPETVSAINEGTTPFPGEDHLDDYLAEVVGSGLLRATTETSLAVKEVDAVVVVVPLFVDDAARPDFSAMDAATAAVGAGLQPGTLVSYETTLPVGTTRDRLTPLLEERSGLRAGRDFFVVFSPERVLTGRVFSDLRKYPKLVGGIDSESERRGKAFYEAVLDFDTRPDLNRPNGVWEMGSSESAELAKLAETSYRDVNIGLANEFARFAEGRGIDISQVIEACNSQPYSHIHAPGIAVGGHCIPVYPRLYLWNDPGATVVAAARETNSLMPEAVIERIEREHGQIQGKTVAILGAAYRGGVKETAFSGVFPLVASLQNRGAAVSVHDPLYTDQELAELGFTPYHLGNRADIVIVQADHSEYSDWTPELTPGVELVFDGRGVINPAFVPESVRCMRIGVAGKETTRR